MTKIGRTRIQEKRNGAKPAKCMNCGGDAEYKVFFRDNWSKLILTLCEDCSLLEYEKLAVQMSIQWPAIA